MMDETTQMRKVALQNHMALNFLTVVWGRTYVK
jgi:hypothetical protein